MIWNEHGKEKWAATNTVNDDDEDDDNNNNNNNNNNNETQRVFLVTEVFTAKTWSISPPTDGSPPSIFILSILCCDAKIL